MKKYLVIPGKVRSKTDSDIHFISASELMKLYKVDKEDCVVVSSPREAAGIKWEDYKVLLRPRTDGDYRAKGCYSFIKAGELIDCTCGECF